MGQREAGVVITKGNPTLGLVSWKCRCRAATQVIDFVQWFCKLLPVRSPQQVVTKDVHLTSSEYNHLSILNAREACLLMWSRVSSRSLGGKAQLLGDGQ